MEDDYISLETATRQLEVVTQDIRQSQRNVLIALLASTVIVFYLSFFGVHIRVLFMRAAIVCNCVAWLLWCASNYLSTIRSPISLNPHDFKARDAFFFVLEQYSWTLREHRRQRLAASMISILIAFEFLLIAAIAFEVASF